jgi:ubiquinone/menaquinone biosynthesis C-methylase UbiE
MTNYFIAGVYDLLLYPFLNRTRKLTAKIIQQINPDSLIDICCGTGNQLKYLGHTNIKLTGVDNSPEMLNSGKLFNCLQQDARNIEFPDQSFDMALIQLALHEKSSDDQLKIIDETHRILKNNGYLVVMDYHIDHKTSKSAKYMINIIEFLAGKEHYSHFKNYKQNGGLSKLIDTNRFDTTRTIHLAGRSMVLKIYRKMN